jgi:hypothetical protein
MINNRPVETVDHLLTRLAELNPAVDEGWTFEDFSGRWPITTLSR